MKPCNLSPLNYPCIPYPKNGHHMARVSEWNLPVGQQDTAILCRAGVSYSIHYYITMHLARKMLHIQVSTHTHTHTHTHQNSDNWKTISSQEKNVSVSTVHSSSWQHFLNISSANSPRCVLLWVESIICPEKGRIVRQESVEVDCFLQRASFPHLSMAQRGSLTL